MSEYQYVTFRALDKPLDQKALNFMSKQSSRAEIDEWSFTNHYHYGDFGGDAVGMLRRGYDVHLHYANFGIRKCTFRLPTGFPDPAAAKQYVCKEGVLWHKDKKGPGGVLEIDPFYEPDQLEELWDVEDFFEELFPLRSELLEGDLRPLYLASAAVRNDCNHDPAETHEAPVPAGLAAATEAQRALARLYDLDEHWIAAAADVSPPIPPPLDRRSAYAQWLRRQSESEKDAWLVELLAGAESCIRADLLARFRAEQTAPGWPTVQSNRTFAELAEAAQQRRAAAQAVAQAQAARRQAKRLLDMAKNPESVLRKTDDLVAQRSTHSYAEAAELLAELRDALADTDQSDLADKHAWELKKKNPTLKHLVGALRRKGFLPK